MRAPILSLDFYQTFTKYKKIEDGAFKEIWHHKLIKEAIFIASPHLFEAIENWLQGKEKNQKNIERLKYALLKYVTRASTRCTPFGLFAGVAHGSFGEKTEITLNNSYQHQRQTRYDMNFSVALADWLSKIPKIKTQLLFYPNTTLYQVANQYRYIEYQYVGADRAYSVEAIEHTPYLESILLKVKSGATILALANSLVTEVITISEAKTFIKELINHQVLVSELTPSVNGDDLLQQLSSALKPLKGVEKYIQILAKLQKAIEIVDNKPGNEMQRYHEIIAIIKSIGVPFDTKYLFQTDLFLKTKQNTLALKHAYSLKKTLPLLNKLKGYVENERLKQFKVAFIARYETREVPLTQALDIESGIGYIQNKSISDTTPFLNDITPTNPKKKEQKQVSFSKGDEIIQKKLFKIIKDKGYVLELEEGDFKEIEEDWNNLPDTMSSLIEIVKLNGEEKIVMSTANGVSGANLLARFCYGDTGILEHTKTIIKAEEAINEGRILAEINHLPESRIGNILRRPHLRAFEIPYLGKSTLPQAQQIQVNDVMVSLKRGRIVLRSKKLNKEIIPRLTNAHNFARKALPMYHFLCDLQTQGKRPSIGFYWNSFANKHVFLPRVVYKNIILSKATWHITKDELIPFFKVCGNEEKLLHCTTDWRKNKQIPQYVQLIESDNTLLVNLENTTTIRLLLDTVRQRENFILKEFLYTEETVVKEEKEGLLIDKPGYANQFVVSFYNEEKLKFSQKK